MLSWLRALAFYAVFSIPIAAGATEHAGPREGSPVREISVRAALGGYDDLEANTGGFSYGATALYRHGYFIGGGLVERGSALLSYQYTGVAPAVGVALPVPSWARADIVVTAGAHAYSGVGGDFLTPGASATVPFGGIRAYAGVPLGGKTFAFTAGVGGFVESDVFRPTVTNTFRNDFFTSRDQTVTRTVGMSRAGIALLLGGTFGL